VSYRDDEIDILVAYIGPEDVWYVFPSSAFEHHEIPAPVATSRQKDFEIRTIPRSLARLPRSEIKNSSELFFRW
jgi:hypothetical protein